MFWIVFSALTLDVSMWESYSDKNIARKEKESKELAIQMDRELEEYRQEMMAHRKERAENDRETMRVMKEIGRYIKDKK